MISVQKDAQEPPPLPKKNESNEIPREVNSVEI